MDYFDLFAKKAEEATPMNDGDYIEDGLMFCGNCKTPKQTVVNLLDTDKTVFCLCKCQREYEKAVKDARLRQDRLRYADEVRSRGYSVLAWRFESDDGTRPDLMKAAKEYAENFNTYFNNGKGLLLYGTVGNGKSYAANCIVNYLVERGTPAMITNFQAIYNGSLGLFGDKQEYYNSFNKPNLLAIDDLFAERDTTTMAEAVFGIIDARSRENLPMLVTSNIIPEQLKNPGEISKDRIISRILGLCHPFHVVGSDKRRDKMKEEYKKTKEELGI